MHPFIIRRSGPASRLAAAFIALAGLALAAPVAQAQDATLTFSFGNGQISGGGTTYEFDVLVATDATSAASDTRIGDTQTYITYSTAGFGAAIGSSVVVTEGFLLQDVGFNAHVIVNVTDNDGDTFAVTTDFIPDGSPQFSTALTTTPQQLLHIALPIADPNQTAGLSFDVMLMQGQQYTATLVPFDVVIASDLDDSALPVELTGLEAQADGAEVVLSWRTASETNNAGFTVEVEREQATVGAGWQAVAFVAGAGTTAQAQRYAVRIPGLGPGLHRFRLKQTDFDGTFSYSSKVEVTIEVAGTYVLSPAYPNPFNPKTSFSLAVAQGQHVTAEVFDVMGRCIEMLFDEEMAAHQTRRFVWEAGNRPSGLYFLRITGEHFRQTQRVTLLR